MQEKKKGFIPFNVNGLKKRIRKWVKAFPEKLFIKDSRQLSKKKEMKPITQEYILDSYDKSGHYHQIEKRGTINDTLNKKA